MKLLCNEQFDPTDVTNKYNVYIYKFYFNTNKIVSDEIRNLSYRHRLVAHFFYFV